MGTLTVVLTQGNVLAIHQTRAATPIMSDAGFGSFEELEQGALRSGVVSFQSSGNTH